MDGQQLLISTGIAEMQLGITETLASYIIES